MTQDLPTEATFALKHGENTTDRLSDDIIKAVVQTLVKNGIEYNGQSYAVKPFSGSGFDVLNVDIYDHIEFDITKTGWGRML